MTCPRPRRWTLIVMAAVEVIYLLAATLWIVVVLAALGIGYRFMVKFRAKRRRINRILDVVRIPVRLCTSQGPEARIPWNINHLLVSVFAEALDVPRKKVARGSRQVHRRPRRGFQGLLHGLLSIHAATELVDGACMHWRYERLLDFVAKYWRPHQIGSNVRGRHGWGATTTSAAQRSSGAVRRCPIGGMAYWSAATPRAVAVGAAEIPWWTDGHR